MLEIGIGDAARLTRTNASTLRLWEQHGLITPRRTVSGHRIYHTQDLARIRIIKRLRTIDGLNMSAIKRVLASDSEPDDGASASTVDRSNGLRQLGIQYRQARLKYGLSLR